MMNHFLRLFPQFGNFAFDSLKLSKCCDREKAAFLVIKYLNAVLAAECDCMYALEDCCDGSVEEDDYWAACERRDLLTDIIFEIESLY